MSMPDVSEFPLGDVVDTPVLPGDFVPDGTAEGVEVMDPLDVDPLFSDLTGKAYKTERGKKIAEGRFRNRGGSAQTPSTRGGSARTLKKRLEGFYTTVGTAVGMFLPMDGQVIVMNAPTCAEAMAEWAESDPRVREALEKLLTGSALGKVVLAHGMMGLGIAANHGFNPMRSLFSAEGATVG